MFRNRKKRLKLENMDRITVSSGNRVYLCLSYDWADAENPKRVAQEYLELVKKTFGCSVYAPPLSCCDLSIRHQADMRRISLDMMALCDAVIICGKRISHEMFEEIAYAEHLGLPVYTLFKQI